MFPTITSTHNPRIKAIRALRTRKERERTGLCFLEGPQLVRAALVTDTQIVCAVVAPELIRSASGRSLLDELVATVPYHVVSEAVFANLCDREHTQGLGLVIRQRWHHLADLPSTPPCWWVALEGVQYPGNLGTIMRTLAATGGAGCLLIGPTADPYEPVAVRASMGAICTQPLVRTIRPELLAWAHAQGAQVIGVTPYGQVDYRIPHYTLPTVLVMGSEGAGLSAALRDACHLQVRIPMAETVDSLNLATATSLMLYEVFRQHLPLS